MGLGEIRQKFGSKGLASFVAGDYPVGSITDDTQMMMFTAEGLLRACCRASTKGTCSPVNVIHHAYVRWLNTQGERSVSRWQSDNYDGWLIRLPQLHACRAPGNTCLSALASGVMGTIERPINNSKGCGGVMRAAPAGLLWFGSDPFRCGCEIAAITHGHPSGYLAAGCLAMIVAELLKATPLEEAVSNTIDVLRSWPNHEECLNAINLALSLSKSGSPSAKEIERIGGGWIAEEAIAISIYCALVAEGSFSKAIRLAVNHSGDSDSTGAITGNIMGAMLGRKAIDEVWLSTLELRDEIETLATDLHTRFREDASWWEKYPGW
jgi:ADP-ribosylglycohydrolase